MLSNIMIQNVRHVDVMMIDGRSTTACLQFICPIHIMNQFIISSRFMRFVARARNAECACAYELNDIYTDILTEGDEDRAERGHSAILIA